jgi:phage terminase large subunit-like protein
MDSTGSMGGEISNAKSGGPAFFDAVRADVPDSTFGVASFEDYPYSTYGDAASGDQPYRRIADLTANRTTWLTGVNSLTTRNGLDTPEAQVPALLAAATGQGLSWPGGSVAGQGISFRDGAAHFIALVSDAPFHNDKTGSDAYSGFVSPTYAEALAALSSGGIRVVAAESNGGTVGADMSGIATDTNGAYTWLNTDGAGLWSGTGVSNSPGISGALRAARYPVTTSTSCAPLQVSLSPSSWADVGGSSALSHTQTISVPSGITPSQLPSDGNADCSIAYTWGAVFIGERHVGVHVNFRTLSGGPPSNAFSIGRTRTNRARGTATLALTLPAAGKLDVLATAAVPARATRTKRIRVARVKRTVTKPGTIRITLTPYKAAKRILKLKGKLKTAVKVTYAPTGGKPRAKTKTLTLRLRRHRS